MSGKGEHTIHKKWSENATNEVYMQLNARNKRRRKHSFSPQRFLYAHEHQMKCCMQRRKISPRGIGEEKVPPPSAATRVRSIQYLNLICNFHT